MLEPEYLLSSSFSEAPPDAAILHLHGSVRFLSPEHSLTCFPLFLVLSFISHRLGNKMYLDLIGGL